MTVHEIRPAGTLTARVVSLTYELKPNERVEFTKPPPRVWANNVADFELRDGVLMCRLKQDYATETDAKLAVKPALREWAALAELEGHPIPFEFDFKTSEIKTETASDSLHATLQETATVKELWSVQSKRTLDTYPNPPTEFTLTAPVLAA